MKYRETLLTISKSISGFSPEGDSALQSLLTTESVENIGIYRSNILKGVIDGLSKDFPATFYYLGENNFSYFSKKYLIEHGIRSPNISDLSKSFPKFLGSEIKTHQDELLIAVAKVDLLWAYGEVGNHLQSTKGLLLFWSHLLQTQEADYSLLSDAAEEKILVDEIEDEKVLKIESSDVR